MPKRIIVIGLLFTICGLLATWQVITDLADNHLNINFAVLLLPVGIGLLCGKKWSQWSARLCLIIGYCLIALLILLTFTSPENARIVWFETELHGQDAVPYVIAIALLLTIAFIVVHRLLYSERSNTYFNRFRDDTVGSNNSHDS